MDGRDSSRSKDQGLEALCFMTSDLLWSVCNAGETRKNVQSEFPDDFFFQWAVTCDLRGLHTSTMLVVAIIDLLFKPSAVEGFYVAQMVLVSRVLLDGLLRLELPAKCPDKSQITCQPETHKRNNVHFCVRC